MKFAPQKQKIAPQKANKTKHLNKKTPIHSRIECIFMFTGVLLFES